MESLSSMDVSLGAASLSSTASGGARGRRGGEGSGRTPLIVAVRGNRDTSDHRIEVLWMSNHNNRMDVFPQAITEMSSEMEFVRVGVIGFELFEGISKLLDVLKHGGGMFDVKKLA